MIFSVVGTDARQKAAGAYLARQGATVVGPSEVWRADYILLPMPLEPEQNELANLLRAAKPGAVAFGGRVGAQARALAGQAGVRLEDYLCREELAQLNAVPTAEGCIALLMENRTTTLWRSHILVTGFGRVGHALTTRLLALGARVTVAVRSPGARATAQGDGARTVPLTELPRAAAGLDTLVNTIPAPVVGKNVLEALAPGALVIDLASKPGGTDFAQAEHLGIKALHALSLPAKCAPETAGQLVGHTVLSMLEEENL